VLVRVGPLPFLVLFPIGLGASLPLLSNIGVSGDSLTRSCPHRQLFPFQEKNASSLPRVLLKYSFPPLFPPPRGFTGLDVAFPESTGSRPAQESLPLFPDLHPGMAPVRTVFRSLVPFPGDERTRAPPFLFHRHLLQVTRAFFFRPDHNVFSRHRRRTPLRHFPSLGFVPRRRSFSYYIAHDGLSFVVSTSPPFFLGFPSRAKDSWSPRQRNPFPYEVRHDEKDFSAPLALAKHIVQPPFLSRTDYEPSSKKRQAISSFSLSTPLWCGERTFFGGKKPPPAQGKHAVPSHTLLSGPPLFGFLVFPSGMTVPFHFPS